jgi:lysophospholipase L1-like esterase
MKRAFRIISILLIYAVVSLVLLEVGLRLIGPKLPPALAAQAQRVMIGQAYPQEWQQAWQQNPDHYWILKPGVNNALQYGSPSVSFHLSTIELWENGGVGFRTRPIDYFVDAVVVGDSFAMCFTEQADCWVEKLPSYFTPPLGVVNLGQPVTGTTSHGRILKTFGEPLKPPLVLWQFFGNDFNDDYGLAVFSKKIEALPDATPPEIPRQPVIAWLEDHSVLFAIGEVVLTGQSGAMTAYERLFIKPYRINIGSEVMRFGAGYEQQAMDMTRRENQIGLEYSRTAFQDAAALVDTWGGQIVVIVIPTREEVYASLTEPMMGTEALNKLRSSHTAMLGLCTELSLTCYDPLPAFQERAAKGEMLYFADDMHLNPHGNAILAESLASWLKEKDLVGVVGEP